MKQQIGGRVHPRSLSRKAVLLVLAILAVAAGAFLLKTTTGLINGWLQSHPAASPNTPRPQVKALSVADKYIAAKALDPEAVSHALPAGSSFNASFKNPCWNSPAIPHLKCLPYFYLMGSFQAGAGTLYQKVAEHPDVITNDKARWQFWAEDTKPMEGYVQEHSSGKTLAAVLHDPANKVIMDGSSSTFAFYWSAGLRAHQAFQRTMVPCWGECSEASKGNVTLRSQCMDRTCHPKALAADQEVARGLGVAYDTLHLPLIMSAVYGSWQPRMVVLLRNPIDRLYCAYWLHPHYKSKYGDSAEGFLAYVKEQVAALRSCSARFVGQPGGPADLPMTPRQAERHCALYFEALGSHEEQIFFHADQIIRGMYSIFLEVWLRHFQRSSMLVLKSEDYFRAPGATVDKVFAFLGLTKPSDPGVVASIARVGQPRSFSATAPAMLPEARQLLQDLYSPYNMELADLLKDPTWLSYERRP
ncbi:P-loop containing nucleoside triphosphate hydrolase protein [Haematococcus lacustris]